MSPALASVCWMLTAMSCIAIVDGAAKYLAASLGGVLVTWGYFVAVLLSLLVYTPFSRVRFRDLTRSARPGLQAARACSLVISISCLFTSLRYLPLAEATIISFTSPLFTVALAGPLLGERVDAGRWAAVAAGMAGAALVVRPGSAVFHWAALLPLLGALFFSLFHLMTRVLSQADPGPVTLFHTFAIGSALLSVAAPTVWSMPTRGEWLVLLASGALGLVAHLSMVRALGLGDASALAPLSYVRLVWALGIGYAAFGQAPDWVSLSGGLVIVLSGLVVLHGAARSRV